MLHYFLVMPTEILYIVSLRLNCYCLVKSHSGASHARPEHLTSFQVSLPKELDPADLASNICSLQTLMDNIEGAISLDQG